MIEFHVNCKDKDEKSKLMRDFHFALKGSPGYIESEIVLSEGDSGNDFYLVVGDNSIKPNKDRRYSIKSNDLTIKSEVN